MALRPHLPLFVTLNLLLFSRRELTESRSFENVCKQLKLFQVSFKWLKVTRGEWNESLQNDWSRLKVTEVDSNWLKPSQSDWNRLESNEQTFKNLFSKVCSVDFSRFEATHSVNSGNFESLKLTWKISVAYKRFQKTGFQSTPVEKIKASCSMETHF